MRTSEIWRSIGLATGVGLLAAAAGCVTEEITRSGLSNFHVSGGSDKDAQASTTNKSRIRQLEKKVEEMPERIDHRLKLAQAYFDDRQYERAIDMLKEVLDRDQRNGEAHFRLGEYYTELNRLSEAEASYRNAIQYSREGFSGPRLALGYTLAMQDKYEEAIGELQKVIALDPGQPTALYYLGCCYDSTGLREKAIEHLERCVAIESPYKPKAEQELKRLKSLTARQGTLQAER